MMISLKAKLAFLAMPKAGSTAIEAALAPHCDIRFEGNPRVKHMNAGRFERFMRPYLEAIGQSEVETVCLMREPVDWLQSWWRYRRRTQIQNTPQSTENTTFEEFSQAFMETRAPAADLGRPSRFVSAKGSEVPAVTHIFAYEDMATAIAFLEGRIGAPLELERRNVSPSGEEVLPEPTLAAIRAHFAPEYAIYEQLPITR